VAGRVGFEPTICGSLSPGSTTIGLTDIDWYAFDTYLINAFHSRTQTEYRSNAKRYWRVLVTGDASPLLGLSDAKRRHAIGALATKELKASLEVVPTDYADHFRFNLLVGSDRPKALRR